MQPRLRVSLHFLLTVFLAAAVCQSVAAQSPTVDEIVEKNLAARGGAEKLRAINTVKMTGRIKGPAGEAPLTVWAKRPNMMRRENSRDGQEIVVAFDGQSVWARNSMVSPAPREITGPMADMTRQDADDFDSALLDYKKKGYKVDLIGTEPVDGLPAYHLKVTKKNGRALDMFL